jgi:IS5 family transposase
MRDPAMKYALYEVTSMRLFAGLSLEDTIPDHAIIINFRHLLEKQDPDFKEVNKRLSTRALLQGSND